MCEKCKAKKVSLWEFHKQRLKFEKEKVAAKDRTYVCGKCGNRFRTTKTKIITEFGVRFCTVVVVFEVLSQLEMLDVTTFLGMKQNVFLNKIMEIGAFMILCLIFMPFLRIVNSFVHWVFARWIKWYADESEGRFEG